MCELLVKAVDAMHSDTVIDRAGSYKRGDVVVIMPDAHDWGSGELDAQVFAIIKKPGVSVNSMAFLLNVDHQPIKNTAALKIAALRRYVHRQPRVARTRKRFSIDIATQQITDKARS